MNSSLPPPSPPGPSGASRPRWLWPVLVVVGFAVVLFAGFVFGRTVDDGESASEADQEAPPATTTPPPATAAPAPSAAPVAPTTAAEPPATAPPGTAEGESEAAAPSPRQPTDAQFFEDFASPSGVDRFRIDVHFRDAQLVADNSNVTWSGDHDMNCGGPDTQRDVHAHESAEFFWYCAPKGAESGHLMTSMSDIDGYTILSFAPDQVFSDFSQVCWDVNLTDLGPRKWTQMLIVPEEAFQANDERLDYISPVTQDVDETAVPMPDGALMFQNWDHAFRMYNGRTETLVDFVTFSVEDKAKRFRHCLSDNGDGTVTMEQERADGEVYVQTVPGTFPDEGRVIFQDDNYTPLKDGPIAGFTWHWDNIEIS